MKKLMVLFWVLSDMVVRGAVTGQLWYGIGNGATADCVLGHINSNGSNATVVIPGGGFTKIDMAVDPAAGLYWVLDPATGPAFGTPSSDPGAVSVIEYRFGNPIAIATNQIGDSADQDVVESMAIDPTNHILYIAEWGATQAASGIEKVTYNPTTGAMTGGYSNPTFLVNNANYSGLDLVLYMSLDLPNHKLYFVDNDNGYSLSPYNPNNAVYVVDTATANPVPTQLSSTSNVTGGFWPGPGVGEGGGTATTDDPDGFVCAVAINAANNLVYFTTVQFNEGGTSATQDALWYVTTTGGAGQLATKVTFPANTGVYHPTENCGLSFDTVGRQLFISDFDQLTGPAANSRILVCQLSADGKSVTSVQTNNMVTLTGNASPNQDAAPLGSTFLSLPIPTVAASASYTNGRGAVSLSPALTVAAPTDGYLAGATVAITSGLLTGDTLAATTTGTSISASYNSGTGVIILTNYDTLGHYQQVLRSLAYNSSNPDPVNGGADTSRSLTWVLNDGLPSIPAGSQNTATTSLNVYEVPAITNVNSVTFTVGSAGSMKIGATGFPIPTLNESGTLPNGVTFNSGTGNLGGTPAAGTGGTYPLVFTAASSVGTNTQNFTLTVDQAAAITNASSATFVVDDFGSIKIGATGFPAPALSENGGDTLPGNVSFNSGTGLLSGSPSAGSAGNYTLHFTAHNGVGSDAAQTFSLVVDQIPMVTCPSDIVTNAAGGVCLLPSVAFAASATGTPTPAISYKLGASVITSPAAFPLGTNTITCTATNLVGTNTCSFTVTVLAGTPPQLAIVRQGRNAVLSWPTNFGCYTLQFAPGMASNNWNNYPGPFVTNGGNIFVTNNLSITNRFFRLEH